MSGAFEGERAVVVGLGVSGRAAAVALAAEGASVRITEARPAEKLDLEAGAEDLADLGDIELLFGGHEPGHLDGATVVVVSPGVPEDARVIGWAGDRGLPIWSELELGARLCRVPFVAITGTNGKTTTTEMVAAAMRASGLRARACGNVGHPFSTAAREGSYQALAVECSSFQLAFHDTLHPRVSVLLNMAPDHLDWHGNFERYREAKARIYLRQTGQDVHVGNRDDPEGAPISERAPCVVRWFRNGSPPRDGVGVVDGRVVGDDGAALGRPRALSRGFLEDAAAAAGASREFGLPDQAIASALGSFAPLPHRGTVVGEVNGVRFVDDSKATNPHAALAALEGVSGAVLIAGGLAKGVDLSPLASASARLAAVVAIGEAASEVARVFDGRVPVHRAGSIDEAVEAAYAAAPPNGVVLLAPACASQDMFRDYRERGDRFAAAAAELVARVSRAASSGGRADA